MQELQDSRKSKAEKTELGAGEIRQGQPGIKYSLSESVQGHTDGHSDGHTVSWKILSLAGVFFLLGKMRVIMNAVKVNENQSATVIKMPDRKNRSYIPNEFFDTIARIRIPGEQMQVLSAIARKTWCWGKESDIISKSQIVQATGISKTHIDRAIKALVDRNILKVTKNGNYSMQEFEINTNYEEWLAVTKKGNKKLPNMGTTKDNKDTITKDIKNPSCPGFENPDEEGSKNHPDTHIPEKHHCLVVHR